MAKHPAQEMAPEEIEAAVEARRDEALKPWRKLAKTVEFPARRGLAPPFDDIPVLLFRYANDDLTEEQRALTEMLLEQSPSARETLAQLQEEQLRDLLDEDKRKLDQLRRDEAQMRDVTAPEDDPE